MGRGEDGRLPGSPDRACSPLAHSTHGNDETTNDSPYWYNTVFSSHVFVFAVLSGCHGNSASRGGELPLKKA